MGIGKKFGAILDGYFDKDELIEILEEFIISKAGKKEELVKRILQNTTVLEYAIKGLLRDSYKEQLVDISDDLGIDSSGNVSELKQDILDELEKDTDDKSLQNKIAVVDACFDKDGIIEIMEEFDMPKAGKKLKLVEIIAKNQSMLEYAIKIGVLDTYKEDVEYLCDKLGIDSDGNKKDLENRIQEYMFKKESSKEVRKESSKEVSKETIEKKYQERTESSKNKGDISIEDLHNNFSRFEWRDMEEIVGKLFEKKGYRVEVTQASGDFGVDVWARKLDEEIAIQVKHYEKDVGFDALTKTVAVTFGKANKAIVISTKSGFSKQSYEYQNDHRHAVELWTSKKLKDEIRNFLL